jgi:hypothetical protein
MAFEKDPDEIGALWIRTSAKGDYMTGEVNGVKVVCFRNKGTHEKAPAWRVLKSKPAQNRADGTAPTQAPESVNASDVPF